MFKQILLPVDLTDRHGTALNIAVELARPSGGEIILFHVIERVEALSIEEERDFYGRLERDARNHLNRLGKQLGEHKVPWRVEIRYGKRAQECVRYATEAGADLIVLTAPRFDPAVLGTGWASMSHQVGILSPCPVLLVK